MHRRSQKTNKNKFVILVMVTIVLSIFVPVFPIKAQVWTDGGTVTFYATPSPMPDLVVTSISWTPISPIEGNTMTFNTYIKNQGDATAGMFEVSSYIDDVKKSERVFYYLDQGSSNYYQFYWTSTQGTHVVKVVVDLGNVVSEQREDNNELAKSFVVAPKPKPDLTVTDITWTPVSIVEGNSVSFKVTMENQGKATATTFKLAFCIDGAKIGEQTISNLYADHHGTTTFSQFSWTATLGSHSVKAIIDSTNVVVEEREDNNELSKAFTVNAKPKPDLTVTSLIWTPTTIVEGNTVYFKATVKNQMGSTAGTFWIALYVDGVKIGEQSVSNLAVGFTTYKQFTWTAIIGDHTVKAVVDSTGIVAEEYEDNNELSKFFTVNYKPKPDLIISDITWTPTSIAENIQATFKVAVKNHGATASSFKVVAYIDDVKTVEQTVPSLGSDATAYVSFYWKAVGQGTHVVKAVADSTGVIVEEREDNNELSKEFIVNPAPPQPKPDLIVTDIVWTPTNPTKGGYMTFCVYVKNQGTGAAGIFNIAYYIDGVKRGEAIDYGLNAGATGYFMFSWVATEGDHIVKALADSNLVVAELNEENNVIEKSFHVG